MNALVTGGAGFIGSHLVDALVSDGHRVRVLDDLSGGDPSYVDPRVDLLRGDVADLDAVQSAVEDTEVVFHHAAHRSVQRSVDNPLETDTANTHGTLTILTAALAAGVRRVVYASSSSVYGGAEIRPTPESAPLIPRSPYTVSKLAGEHYCKVFTDLHGLETVSLRYFNVYGPRQSPRSRYAAVIPLFITAALQGEAPTIFGDGRQSRDFTFVSDAVAANLAAARATAEVCGGRAYNVAGGASHTLLDLLALLERICDTEIRPVHVEPRSGDVRHSEADIRRARRELGYEPVVGIEEGLRLTVKWLESQAGERAATHKP